MAVRPVTGQGPMGVRSTPAYRRRQPTTAESFGGPPDTQRDLLPDQQQFLDQYNFQQAELDAQEAAGLAPSREGQAGGSLGELVFDAVTGTWNAAGAVFNSPVDAFEAGSNLFAEKVVKPFYEWQPSDWLPEIGNYPDTGNLPLFNPAELVQGLDLAKNLAFPLMSQDLDVIPGYDSEEMDTHPNTAMLVPFGGAVGAGLKGLRRFLKWGDEAVDAGTALSRVGDDVGDVWRSPVADAPTRVSYEHPDRAARIAEFDALPDDTMITVFHGTNATDAANIASTGVAGRSVMYPERGAMDWAPEAGMFVSPQRIHAATYTAGSAGTDVGEVIELVVRKGDLRSPKAEHFVMPSMEPPNTGTLGTNAYGGAGVYIPEGTPLTIVGRRSTTPDEILDATYGPGAAAQRAEWADPQLARLAEMDAADAATDVVARIEDVYKNAEGKDLFEHYRDLADASGYTDEIAIGQPERYGVRADPEGVYGPRGGERSYFVPHHSNREDFLSWLQFKTDALPEGDIHDLMRDINEYAQAKLFGDG